MTAYLKYCLFVGITFFLASCELPDENCDESSDYECEEDASVTSNVYRITTNSADIEGSISTHGGSVCVYYSTSENKLGRYGCETSDGIATDYHYQITLQCLAPHTKYYYKVFYDGATSYGSFITK